MRKYNPMFFILIGLFSIMIILLIVFLSIGISKIKKTEQAYYDSIDHGMEFEIVELGRYPNNLVKDEDTIQLLNNKVIIPNSLELNGWNDYEYYLDSNIESYMYYIDIDINDDTIFDYRGVYFTEQRTVYTETVTNNEHNYQLENGYEINNIYWFKYETIRWFVMKTDGNKKLLLTESIIDSQEYHTDRQDDAFEHNGGMGYSNDYVLSNIRKWLNDNFYNTAFNEAEKAKILETTVDNGLTSMRANSLYYSENTNDYVFLFSYMEALELFNSFSDRMAFGTDYAQSQGLFVNRQINEPESSYWYLRTPGSNYPYDSYFVTYFGGVHDNFYVNRTYYGIRPAIWIE